jgi:hypothetical protein
MRDTTHPLRDDGLRGRHIDGSCTVRGYAFPILTGYCKWEDIIVYDDRVKVTDDHPVFSYHGCVRSDNIVIVWITEKSADIGGFGIHHWSKGRSWGGMGFEPTLDLALERFNLMRNKPATQPTLF